MRQSEPNKKHFHLAVSLSVKKPLAEQPTLARIAPLQHIQHRVSITRMIKSQSKYFDSRHQSRDLSML